VSVLDRLLGRGAQAAARALILDARSAAPDLARAAGGDVDVRQATAMALVLAKLCFDRVASSPAAGGPRHGSNALGLMTKASASLYHAIATELAIESSAAAAMCVEVAHELRLGLETRGAMAGAEVVARELLCRVAGRESGDAAPVDIVARVDTLIKQFTATALRELGWRP
jgi:hypothetical protein